MITDADIKKIISKEKKETDVVTLYKNIGPYVLYKVTPNTRQEQSNTLYMAIDRRTGKVLYGSVGLEFKLMN